ncbi:MAG: universal stress protein [Actinomycetota bacterium]
MSQQRVGAPTRSSAWVVGDDGSSDSRHAARWAAVHAAGRTDELRFVRAWHVPVGASYPAPSLTPAHIADDLEKGAWESVNEVADSFRASTPVPITTVTACGGGSRVLLDAAPPDGLIVVGRRGRGGFGRLLLGSTSTQVATHAPVPTVVVPLDARIETLERVVVAVDGSPNSLAALTCALGTAPVGAKIECVMVWDVSPLSVGSDQFVIPEASGAAEARLDHIVGRLAATRAGEVDVSARFVEGRARPELRRLGESADLLVMGARGHGAVGAALLGSVSTWLLHHASVPMVVVPSPGDIDLGPISDRAVRAVEEPVGAAAGR